MFGLTARSSQRQAVVAVAGFIAVELGVTAGVLLAAWWWS